MSRRIRPCGSRSRETEIRAVDTRVRHEVPTLQSQPPTPVPQRAKMPWQYPLLLSCQAHPEQRSPRRMLFRWARPVPTRHLAVQSPFLLPRAESHSPSGRHAPIESPEARPATRSTQRSDANSRCVNLRKYLCRKAKFALVLPRPLLRPSPGLLRRPPGFQDGRDAKSGDVRPSRNIGTSAKLQFCFLIRRLVFELDQTASWLVSPKCHWLTVWIPRCPNSAVPTRTSVAPSSIATSKSWDIPIDRTGNATPSFLAKSSRNSRKLRKYGRTRSASSKNGGIHISPASSNRCSSPNFSANTESSSTSTPLFVSSSATRTSISTRSLPVMPASARARSSRCAIAISSTESML